MGDKILETRAKLKVLERLRQAGGATLVVGDDGKIEITVFRNTKGIRHDRRK